jgi:hypothetical protein
MKKESEKIKKISVDDLALMIQRGFSEQGKKLDEFKDEMYEFKDEMYEFKNQAGKTLFSIDSKLKDVDKRLDTIEKTLGPLVHVVDVMKINWRDHENRILNLEKRMDLVSK